jgi:hypothetical protein
VNSWIMCWSVIAKAGKTASLSQPLHISHVSWPFLILFYWTYLWNCGGWMCRSSHDWFKVVPSSYLHLIWFRGTGHIYIE